MYEVDGIMMCGGKFCTHYEIIKQEAPSKTIIYHREVMLRMKKTVDRVEYLLLTRKNTRNLDDFDFLCFYWEYLLGFTIGMEWTSFWKLQIKKFALPETVRRSHQMICEPELKIIKDLLEPVKQTMNQYLDMPLINQAHYDIDKFLKSTKFIPTDLELIKKKLEKQAAIFETVVMEKIVA